MALIDELQAIRNDSSLTEEQKRKAARRLKASRLATRAEALAGRSFTKDGLTITLLQAKLQGDHLAVWCSAMRNGVEVPIPNTALPFVFVNPPTRVVEGEGSREDFVEALKQIIVDAVGRYG